MANATFSRESFFTPQTFEKISEAYGGKIIKSLSKLTVDTNALMFAVKRAWDDPTDKIPLQPASGRDESSQLIRAVSLQARSGTIERAVDKGTYALTGLARVDIVFALNNDEIVSFETGWNFESNRISIEGARKMELGNGRGASLTPETADRFLAAWLSH